MNQFLVRWKDSLPHDDSWEWLDDIRSANEALKKNFHTRHEIQKPPRTSALQDEAECNSRNSPMNERTHEPRPQRHRVVPTQRRLESIAQGNAQ